MKKKDKVISKTSQNNNQEQSILDMTIPLKFILSGGFALSVVILPLTYNFGKWMQKTEDHLMLTKKEQELNAQRTQLTIDFNQKLIEIERKNASLETKIEMYERKEGKNGK